MLSTTPTECSPRHAPRAKTPGVDLHVEVAVRVAGSRGVVTYDSRLDHLLRHLNLSAARPDARGGVRGHPTDHFTGCSIHRGVVRRRDVGMESGGERPGLRPVDDDLDESQRACVLAQASFGRAGQYVVAGDPAFVPRAVEVPDALHPSGAGDVVLGQAAAFGQVVVVGARLVRLDVRARGSGRAAVELRSTVHRPRHRPPESVKHPENGARPVPGGRTVYGIS
jgi:hypothetical protein